jgi:pimeloyl-ACP methyl ester carboxylesterase
MNTPPAIGRLQARCATLIYQTIGYQARGAAGHSTIPFIFQHGMGGDANQPLGYIGDAPPTPVICLNARGHSPSTDINAAAASFEVFADDVIALADHLGLVRFIMGGVSLGAGTALNLAVRYPDRVTALVLCRPAWLDRPQAEFNRNAYTEIADLLDRYPAEHAAKRYPRTRTYQTVRNSSPAAAASLLGQLTRPRAAQNSVHPAHLPRFQPDELDRHLAGLGHPHACHRAPRRPLPPVRDRPSAQRHDPRGHPAHRPQQRRRRCTLRRRHPNCTPQLPPPTVSTMCPC